MPNCPFRPQLVIPSTFEECLSYEQQIAYLASKLAEQQDTIDDLEDRVEALEDEVETNPET